MLSWHWARLMGHEWSHRVVVPHVPWIPHSGCAYAPMTSGSGPTGPTEKFAPIPSGSQRVTMPHTIGACCIQSYHVCTWVWGPRWRGERKDRLQLSAHQEWPFVIQQQTLWQQTACASCLLTNSWLRRDASWADRGHLSFYHRPQTQSLKHHSCTAHLYIVMSIKINNDSEKWYWSHQCLWSHDLTVL